MTTRYTTHFLLSAALLLGAAQNISAFTEDAFFSDENPSCTGFFQAPKPSVAKDPSKAIEPVEKTNDKENLLNAPIEDIQPLHNNDLMTRAQSAYAYMQAELKDLQTGTKSNTRPEVEGPTMSAQANDFVRPAKDAVVAGAQNVHAPLTQPTQMPTTTLQPQAPTKPPQNPSPASKPTNSFHKTMYRGMANYKQLREQIKI